MRKKKVNLDAPVQEDSVEEPVLESDKEIQDIKINDGNIKIEKFDDLENKFLLVRVGTKDEPATDAQIKEIEDKIINLFSENNVNCLVFVTHHAIGMEIIEKKS